MPKPPPKRDIRIEFPSAGATYSREEYGVYEYTTYPRSSVLAGQQRRQFLAAFDTIEEARAAYPGADESDCGYQPPFLGHLPDEEDDEEYAFGGHAAADNHAEELAERADQLDDRDDSPIEMTERTLERWDFDSDPDWR